MAWITIPGRIFYPHLYGTGSSSIDWATGDSFTLNATADRVAFVFTVPVDGDIEGLVFATRSVTTSQSLDIRLETIDSDGHPTGTLVATGAEGTQASVASNTQYLVSLGTPYAAQAGAVLALIIRFTSTAGNLNILGTHGSSSVLCVQHPYLDFNGAGSWAIYDRVCNFAVKISGGYPFCGGLPYREIVKYEYENGYQVGLRFKLAVGMKICGLWARFARYTNDTYGATLRLYNPADTVLASRNFNDKATGGRGLHMFYFDEIELAADTVYRITVEAANAAYGIFVEQVDGSSNAYLDAWPGGKECYLAEYEFGVGWSYSDSVRVTAMGIIVSALQGGGGGGGLLVHPGMTGGMGA
jgi:hypothetical protein